MEEKLNQRREGQFAEHYITVIENTLSSDKDQKFKPFSILTKSNAKQVPNEMVAAFEQGVNDLVGDQQSDKKLQPFAAYVSQPTNEILPQN